MRRQLKKLWFLVSLCLAMGLTTAQAAEKALRIAFIPKSSDQVFWDLMRGGVDQAVREDPRIQLTWRGPAHNNDTEAQIKIVQIFTKAGVDAIVIAPTDRARLVESVKDAAALGIKVIAVDSGLDGNHHTNYVTSNNIAGGQMAAKALADILSKKGRVAVLRTVKGSASTDERADGFVSYLKTYAPGMTVVADEHGGGSAGNLRRSAALLLKSPQIDGVFAVNESATDGMLRALREAGLAGKVRFVGFDATEFLIGGLEKREVDGLVIQNPRQMGYMSIKAAVAAIDKAPSQGATLYTDTTLVTRENYQSPAIQKMMCSQC
jgi:ribose transport system substrate-binding protein